MKEVDVRAIAAVDSMDKNRPASADVLKKLVGLGIDAASVSKVLTRGTLELSAVEERGGLRFEVYSVPATNKGKEGFFEFSVTFSKAGKALVTDIDFNSFKEKSKKDLEVHERFKDVRAAMSKAKAELHSECPSLWTFSFW